MISIDTETDLKEGMLVILYRGNRHHLKRIIKVNKATFKVDNVLFNRSTGHLRGRSDWSYCRVGLPEPGEIEELKKDQIQRNKRRKVQYFLEEIIKEINIKECEKVYDCLNKEGLLK